MQINILTTRYVSGSRALTPVVKNLQLLRDRGFNIRIMYDEDSELYDADCVIFDGRVYREWPDGHSDRGVNGLLERLNKRVGMVHWLDTTDGTGTTQFQFLPYINKYFKLQILKDKTKYLNTYYGGRCFTDYYHRHFGVTDTVEYGPIIPPSDLNKIGVAWGHPMADYGRWAPWLRRLRRWVPMPTWYTQKFVEPIERSIDISFRFGTNYRRETVAFQRLLIQQHAKSIGFKTEKIPRPKYLHELKQCKVAVSPFGWGEPSYKDFEVVINGVALIKPDVSHMETWPNFYIEGKTYLPFKWDCSDLDSVLNEALTGNRANELASEAQTLYKRYLFGEQAGELFCDRFQNIVS